jgi:hypothetical protein
MITTYPKIRFGKKKNLPSKYTPSIDLNENKARRFAAFLETQRKAGFTFPVDLKSWEPSPLYQIPGFHSLVRRGVYSVDSYDRWYRQNIRQVANGTLVEPRPKLAKKKSMDTSSPSIGAINKGKRSKAEKYKTVPGSKIYHNG